MENSTKQMSEDINQVNLAMVSNAEMLSKIVLRKPMFNKAYKEAKQVMNEPIKIREVSEVINKINPGKVLGPDGLSDSCCKSFED